MKCLFLWKWLKSCSCFSPRLTGKKDVNRATHLFLAQLQHQENAPNLQAVKKSRAETWMRAMCKCGWTKKRKTCKATQQRKRKREKFVQKKNYSTDLVLLEYLKATWDFRSEQHITSYVTRCEIKIYTALKQKHRQSVTRKIVFNSLDCTSLSSDCERVFFVLSFHHSFFTLSLTRSLISPFRPFR